MTNSCFRWESEIDADIYKSLSGIIKNQGYFKSDKQSNLFKPRMLKAKEKEFYQHYYLDHPDVEDILGTIYIQGCNPPFIYKEFKEREPGKNKKTLVKVEKKNQYLIVVGGLSTFVQTGRGMIPAKWVFIMDSQGVVKKYKMKYKFLPRGSREPAIGYFSSATLEFERKSNKSLKLDVEPYDLTFKKSQKKLKEIEKKKGDLQYIGKVGEKSTLTLKLKKHTVTEGSRYGPSYAYFFEDTKGNKIIWFASRDRELKEGKTYKVEGKVKKHDEYNGFKQTYITRCKIIE